MISFDSLYSQTLILLEMARPNKLIPSIIGPTLFARYEELIKKVNYCMKYGKDLKGNELIDVNGKVSEGLGDEILQDRRYRYFFFTLNKFNKTIKKISDNPKLAYIKADVSSNIFLQKLLDEYNSSGTTTTKLLIGNAFSILKNEQYFLSIEFENSLLNPTNIANYMNFLRVKNDGMGTSVKSATKREQLFNMNISDIHGVLSRTRDDRSKMNREKQYQKLRTRSLPNS